MVTGIKAREVGGVILYVECGEEVRVWPQLSPSYSPAIIQDVLLQYSKDSAASRYDLRKTFCVISLRPPHVTRYAVQVFLEGC